jgi:uncharacterized SAM-binding protein YcdF (DUF218 family)
VAPAILAAAIITSLLPAPRHAILRTAGWSLVAEDPLAAADVIVVAVDGGQAGALEAADLVRQGIAGRVALLADPSTAAERELRRRGIAYEDGTDILARHLRLLGVPAVERISNAVDGTEAAGRVLGEWCVREQLKSVIIVTNADHSRRVRRVLQRSMGRCAAKVLVRSARYSQFDPNSWWRSRTGVRTQIVETEKLLLDIARHPWS